MTNVIEINHLSKSFGDVKAVCDLSFNVKEGELFALYIVCNYGDNSQKEQSKHYRGVSARVRVFCAVCY